MVVVRAKSSSQRKAEARKRRERKAKRRKELAKRREIRLKTREKAKTLSVEEEAKIQAEVTKKVEKRQKIEEFKTRSDFIRFGSERTESLFATAQIEQRIKDDPEFAAQRQQVIRDVQAQVATQTALTLARKQGEGVSPSQFRAETGFELQVPKRGGKVTAAEIAEREIITRATLKFGEGLRQEERKRLAGFTGLPIAADPTGGPTARTILSDLSTGRAKIVIGVPPLPTPFPTADQIPTRRQSFKERFFPGEEEFLKQSRDIRRRQIKFGRSEIVFNIKKLAGTISGGEGFVLRGFTPFGARFEFGTGKPFEQRGKVGQTVERLALLPAGGGVLAGGGLAIAGEKISLLSRGAAAGTIDFDIETGKRVLSTEPGIGVAQSDVVRAVSPIFKDPETGKFEFSPEGAAAVIGAAAGAGVKATTQFFRPVKIPKNITLKTTVSQKVVRDVAQVRGLEKALGPDTFGSQIFGTPSGKVTRFSPAGQQLIPLVKAGKISIQRGTSAGVGVTRITNLQTGRAATVITQGGRTSIVSTTPRGFGITTGTIRTTRPFLGKQVTGPGRAFFQKTPKLIQERLLDIRLREPLRLDQQRTVRVQEGKNIVTRVKPGSPLKQTLIQEGSAVRQQVFKTGFFGGKTTVTSKVQVRSTLQTITTASKKIRTTGKIVVTERLGRALSGPGIGDKEVSSSVNFDKLLGKSSKQLDKRTGIEFRKVIKDTARQKPIIQIGEPQARQITVDVGEGTTILDFSGNIRQTTFPFTITKGSKFFSVGQQAGQFPTGPGGLTLFKDINNQLTGQSLQPLLKTSIKSTFKPGGLPSDTGPSQFKLFAGKKAQSQLLIAPEQIQISASKINSQSQGSTAQQAISSQISSGQGNVVNVPRIEPIFKGQNIFKLAPSIKPLNIPTIVRFQPVTSGFVLDQTNILGIQNSLSSQFNSQVRNTSLLAPQRLQLRTRQTQSLASSIQLSQIQISKTQTSLKSLNVTKTQQRTSQQTQLRVLQQPFQVTEQITSQAPFVTTGSGAPTSLPPTNIIGDPLFPLPPDLPDLKPFTQKTQKSQRRRLSRSFAFKPDIQAVITGQRGRAPDRVTGLERRFLPTTAPRIFRTSRRLSL